MMMNEMIEIMKEKAKKKPVKIVVCEGWDERCLQATFEILEEGLAEVILLGNPDEVWSKAKSLKLDISKAEIHDFKNSSLKKDLAEKLFKLREKKGMTMEQAEKLIGNENYFGCMYAYAGYADAVAGSAICPTADLMRPVLQLLRKPNTLVSEVSIMEDVKNDRIIFVSDGSMNIEPSSEDLCQMALNAAECVRDFGIAPKVAILSFSTKGSGGETPGILTIRKAVDLVREKDKDLLIDGELQVDAAVHPWAAKRKCPDSPLKGEANTLIFPNLTASNIFMHSMLQFSDAKLSFTVMKGLQKPVAILGRSTPLDTVRTMMLSLAMQVNS